MQILNAFFGSVFATECVDELPDRRMFFMATIKIS